MSTPIPSVRAVLDADGAVVSTARNAYQLVLEDGRWRIAVTTPLDAG